MKKLLNIFWFVMMGLSLFTQTLVELDGAIKIGNFTDPNPELGTLRWSGTDFEVWNGLIWASLTGNKEVGTVTDVDGNTYKTIRIGDQLWMAENLRVSHYRNGDPILHIEDSTNWVEAFNGPGAWCWYENNELNDLIYGKLYNGSAAGDSRGVCPTGYDVPNMEEFLELYIYLGDDSKAGSKLKKLSDLWDPPNIGTNNESGFSGLPGGSRFTLSGMDFSGKGQAGSWFVGESGSLAYFFSISYDQESIDHASGTNTSGRSIRCIKE